MPPDRESPASEDSRVRRDFVLSLTLNGERSTLTQPRANLVSTAEDFADATAAWAWAGGLEQRHGQQGGGDCRDQAGHDFGASPICESVCVHSGSNPSRQTMMRSGESIALGTTAG